MKTHFSEKELGECLELVIDHRGKTPKKLGADWLDSGIPTISAKNVNGGRLVATDDIRYVSHDVYKRWMKEDVKRGDCFLVSEGATLGECMMWDHDYPVVLGQRIFCLRANPTVLYSRYLYAYMTSASFQSEIVGRSTGTSVDGLRQTEVLKLKLRLPPMSEQKQIGDALYSLDKMIELNRRMNATLEAMARALFQSWFVDFDPVRAKIDGRKPVGLDPATASLFPEHLEDSPLGHIPQGWKACPLADLIEVVKGRSYRSEELAESKTALVTLKSFLRGGGYRTDGLKPFTGEYKPKQRVRPGDLVVAFTDVTQAADVIGKPALVRSDDRFETLVASLDVGIVRPKSKHVSIPFLYCLFLTTEFQAHTYSHATGTTVLHLGSTAIPSFVSVVPPVEIAEKFAERAGPIFRLIDENAKQSRTLATLRDTLLPKLLSGEFSPSKL